MREGCAGCGWRVSAARSACRCVLSAFFFNDTATTEIYTLSLHDALPIFIRLHGCNFKRRQLASGLCKHGKRSEEHTSELKSRFGISYAVFCLKKTK